MVAELDTNSADKKVGDSVDWLVQLTVYALADMLEKSMVAWLAALLAAYLAAWWVALMVALWDVLLAADLVA